MSTTHLDPLHQFLVQPLTHIHVWGLDLTITNSAMFMILACGLIIGFFGFALRKAKKTPGLLQSFAEIPLAFIQTMVKDSNGPEGLGFVSLIASIFLFVLTGNLLGMLPFSFTFTSQLIVNFALALLIVSVITLYGFIKHGFGFLRLFCPKDVPWWVAPILVPIELISYFSRPISLAIRLFANMVAGHSMLKIFAYFTVTTGILGMMPLAVNVALMGFEILVAFLQAYVFAMLCCIYLNDALHLH
jgi:F-type H+-transporting ATPase subunit a